MDNTQEDSPLKENQTFTTSEIIHYTRWAITYCRSINKHSYPIFIFFHLLDNLKSISSTFVFGFMINSISLFATQGFNSFIAWKTFLVYSGYQFIENIFELFRERYTISQKQKTEIKLKQNFLSKLSRLDTHKFDSSFTTEGLTEKYSYSVSTFSHYYKSLVFISDLLAAIILLAIITYFAWPLTIVIVLLTIPRFFIDKNLRKNYYLAQKNAEPITKDLRRTVSPWLSPNSLKMIISQNLGSLLQNKFQNIQNSWQHTVGNSYNRWKATNRILDLINGLISVIGSAWVLFNNSQLTAIGSVYIQLQLIRLLQNKLKQIVVNFNALEENCNQLASAQKVFSWNESSKPLPSPTETTQSLEFRNLTFLAQDLLSPNNPGINFKINLHDKTDIISINPSCGEYLARFLWGHLSLPTGEIFINDQKVDPPLPSEIMIVSPNTYYNFLTIKENIALNTDWDQVKADGVLTTADLKTKLSQYPKQENQNLLDLPLLPNLPDLISRILLARVLYHQPKWLVWISPSKISSHNELEIFTILYRLVPTVVTITERFTSSKVAQHIIFMRNYKIVEQGSPSDLITQNGDYAKVMEKINNANLPPSPVQNHPLL